MKKTLSMLLVLTLTLSMAVTAFALTTTGKITGMADSLALGYSGANGSYADLGHVYPQDERVEYINLLDSMFTWSDNAAPSATPTQLTQAQIRDARIDVRSAKQNSKVIDSISVNTRESRVEIKFKDQYTGTKDIDFDFDVVLTLDGRRQSDYGMNFSGTFGNQVIELYSGYDTVDISDGSVGEAQEYISKLKVDIGNGVSITTRLSKDKRVYGVTTRTPDNSDDEVMREYRDITDVLRLNTVGLDGSGSVVKLSGEYRDYYVYGKDMAYLGKGSDELTYSDRYYLSVKKLNIPDPEDEVSEAPEKDVSEPATPAPVDKTPPNVNHNPGTGR